MSSGRTLTLYEARTQKCSKIIVQGDNVTKQLRKNVSKIFTQQISRTTTNNERMVGTLEQMVKRMEKQT